MATKILPEVQKLIDIYTKAQEQLVKIIKEKEAKGTMTAYQKSLLKQVMEQLNTLDNEAKNWTNQVISDFYNAGADAVDSYLKNNDLDMGFSQLNTGAIQALIDDCYGKLNDANNFIGRRIQDAVRQAGIDTVAQKLAQGQTVNQCKKNLIQSLLNEGITCIKDKRGRNIDLSSYAEVVARSTTREATNTATLNQLQGNGYDLVKMSSHSPTCSICAIYQGRVYSISGNNPDYPSLDTAYSGEYANIHPNCAHVLEPYIPSLADDPKGDMDFSNRPFELSDKDKNMLEQYNNQQAQKAQLRMDRKQYEKCKTVLGNDAPGNFGAFRSMKLSNSQGWQDLQDYYNYLKNNPDSDKIYYSINKKIENLRNEGLIRIKGVAVKPIPTEIKELNEHTLLRMDARSITKEDIQSFINNSIVAFKQRKGTQCAYYSEKGFAAISDDGIVKSTGWLDEAGKLIIEEVNKIVKG